MELIDQKIATTACGRSFCDLGGLFEIRNEKITVAAEAGARSVAIIDKDPAHEQWEAFHLRCRAAGLRGYQSIVADVMDPLLPIRVGRFEVVHSSGVLYHMSNPLEMLRRLHDLCSGTLFLGTTVIETRIENKAGTLTCDSGGALFVPALADTARAVASEHYEAAGARILCGLNEPTEWRLDNNAAWWWLFTPECVRAMLDLAGFDVHDSWEYWSGRARYYLTTRRDEAQRTTLSNNNQASPRSSRDGL